MANRLAERDVIIAIVIALVVLMVLACFHFRIRPTDLDGYWGTFGGSQYRIRAHPGGNVAVTGARFQARGELRPLRGVCVGNGAGTLCATLDPKKKWLTWADGTVWLRQGPPHSRSRAEPSS